MGAFSRFRTYLQQWWKTKVWTYEYFAENFPKDMLTWFTGLTVGTVHTVTPATWAIGVSYAFGQIIEYSGSNYISLHDANIGNQPDISAADWAVTTMNVYYPDAGGEKDGEIYLSNNIAGAPQQAWIWQGVTWYPLGAFGATGYVPGPQTQNYLKNEDDAEDQGLYRETTPAGSPTPTSVIWWTSAGKTEKVKEITITYNVNNTPATVSWKYYISGVEVREYVDTISYSGVFETARTRVINITGTTPPSPAPQYLKYDEDADDSAGYREITGAPFPTAIIWWETAAKLVKVKEILITLNGANVPTQVQWKFYAAGVLDTTYTDTITYSPGTLIEASRTRVIT